MWVLKTEGIAIVIFILRLFGLPGRKTPLLTRFLVTSDLLWLLHRWLFYARVRRFFFLIRISSAKLRWLWFDWFIV